MHDGQQLISSQLKKPYNNNNSSTNMSSYSPELIPSCKETKMLRFRSRMEGAVKQHRPHSMKPVNLSLLISCVLSGLVGLSYLFFDPIVRSIILSKLTLRNTSETFYIWEDPPISPHLKVYFFNLTNPEEFFAGHSKPVLEEIGPFTYWQKWLKQNITWHPNGTISYRTKKIFSFSPEDSCVKCRDPNLSITTANVPAISAYHQLRDSYFSALVLSGMIYGLNYKPWSSRTPSELLWGHKETLFEIAKHTMPDPPPFNQFGFFLTKNASKEEDLGLYTMYTGEGDPYKLATIASYNGHTNLGRWNDSNCDKVHGSDGASFNPYIQQHDTLWFFNDQLCRALPLVFHQTVLHKGLPSYRFRPREDVFMSPDRYPQENSCFGGPDRVTGDGIFDVTICQYNAPIVLSWPHFLHADRKYLDAVEGMRPDPNEHGFWFDIQPVTGTTLSARARIQINVNIRNTPRFDDLALVNDTLLPVLWCDEGIDELGDEIIMVLKTAAMDPLDYRRYIFYTFLALLSTLLTLSLVAVARCCANRAAANVDKVREQVKHLAPAYCDREAGSAIQPMLDSTDSSRVSTACHSRNCSEGATPLYVKDASEERLLEQLEHLPHHFGCRPATTFNTAIRVVIPETLLGGTRGEEEEEEEILEAKEDEDC